MGKALQNPNTTQGLVADISCSRLLAITGRCVCACWRCISCGGGLLESLLTAGTGSRSFWQ
eukprot:15270786-Alexandrium_andersonii.AAC.1